jgi:hypothetical protein
MAPPAIIRIANKVENVDAPAWQVGPHSFKASYPQEPIPSMKTH